MRDWWGKREVVVEEDRKLEVDRRQQERQLWLQEGSANTKFIHLADDRRRVSQILTM